MSKSRVVLLLIVALLALGCGRGDSESTVSTVDELGAALAETAEVTTYRVSVTTAETNTLGFGALLGAPEIDEMRTSDIDELPPALVGEVSPARQHFVVDMVASAGFVPSDELNLKVEMWIDDERLVIDTRELQKLFDASDAQATPFEPGIAYVDLAELAAEYPDVLAALGASPPDLRELAEKLPAALTNVEQTSSTPPIFIGTGTLTDLAEAQGQDIEDLAGDEFAGSSSDSSTDTDAETQFFVDFFDSVEVEVVVELDEHGLLRVFSTRADLSNLYDAMLEAEGFFHGITDSERLELMDLFAGAEFILETRTVLEVDADLEVPLPPAATVDDTDLFREFLEGGPLG